MLSIVLKGKLVYYVDGVPTYSYTFSDGSVKNFSDVDAQEWIDTQNQLQQLQSTSDSPTKINLTTGAGVPGGLDIGSIKSPSSQITKLTSTANSVSSTAIGLISALASGTSNISLGSLKILGNMATANLTKLKVAASIPDFSKIISIPSPPTLPTIPNFSAMGIPSIPSTQAALPSIPTPTTIPSISPISGLPTPSVSSSPSAPPSPSDASVGVSVPSTPSIPTTSIPSTTYVPPVATLPNGQNASTTGVSVNQDTGITDLSSNPQSVQNRLQEQNSQLALSGKGIDYTSPYSGVTYHNVKPDQTDEIVGWEKTAGVSPK